MPALYRMPITYVFILIAVLAWTILDRLPRDGERPIDVAETSIDRSNPGKPGTGLTAPVPKPVETASADTTPDLILRTSEGLRRKVIVTDLDVVPRARADAPAAKLPALDYLAIRYLFAETPTMVQVGKGELAEFWIPRSSVLEWDTRLMAKPTPQAGRPAITIYEEAGCLEPVVTGGICPKHAGNCPTLGEEPTEKPGVPSAVLGWPILSSRVLKLHDGTTANLLEVAPLVNDRAPPPSEPPADMRPALRTVYIAFVIDTTASMQSTIDSVREVAAKLAGEAGKTYADVTLRLGLVVYRDTSASFGYVAKRVTGFAEPAEFLKALSTIEAAKRGDGSVDESVLEGVALALPGGPDHLEWPGGREADLATKVLVLLGDAPDHDRDLIRAGKLAALASREQITIASVALKSPTILSKDERSRYEAQWRTLAEGSYRPPDRRQGFTRPIPPQRLSLGEVGTLSQTLVTLIEARINRARELAALAAAEAEGRLADYVNSQGLTAQQVAPVLEDLHRGNAQSARPNLAFEGKKAPTLRRGWIARRRGGVDLVTLQMLLSAEELDLLIGELTTLQQATRGSTSELAKLVEVGNAAAAGETSFLAKDRGRQTFADHLQRRQGVAPSRPDSLLLRSQTDLFRADAIDRAALDRRLGESLLGLIRRRNDSDWTTQGRTVEGKALVPFAWIDF